MVNITLKLTKQPSAIKSVCVVCLTLVTTRVRKRSYDDTYKHSKYSISILYDEYNSNFLDIFSGSKCLLIMAVLNR